MAFSLRLLLTIVVVCGPAAAFVKGRDAVQQVNDVLTEKLFAVSSLLTTIEQHVQQLESWEGNTGGINLRLAALEASQQNATKQLATVLQRLEVISADASQARTSLAKVTESQSNTASMLNALRNDLKKSIADVQVSVSSLENSNVAQHSETRTACQQSTVDLSESLAELRTAVSQAAELAQRNAATLSSGLESVDSRMQETTRQLESLGRELRENHQALLTTTTAAPTEDPQQAFLNSLYQSLSKRRSD